MAGKHDAIDLLATSRPVYPGTRDDRAYSEGRQNAFAGGVALDNPHVIGTPEFLAYASGFNEADVAAAQIQTAYAGAIP